MYDLSFFYREGFQILSNLVPIDVIKQVHNFLNQEAQVTIEELIKFFGLKDQKSLSAKIVELSKTEDFNHLERALQMKLSGHFSLETRLSSHLLNVVKSQSVINLYENIFPGRTPRLHMPPTARFVLPQNSFAGVPPHQDVSYNTHIEDFFVLWIPFCDITDTKGGVQIFKGTNQPKQINLPHGKNFWLEGINVAGAESIHCKMKAGDALLLNKWIVHASMPNVSDEIRISSDYRFFCGSSDKHFFDYHQDKIIAPLT